MDEVAAKAAISKPTVYKYFSDKEQLFAEIVHATAGEIDDLMRLVAESMAGTINVEPGAPAHGAGAALHQAPLRLGGEHAPHSRQAPPSHKLPSRKVAQLDEWKGLFLAD
jgi:AcrR family transcriptional regulator